LATVVAVSGCGTGSSEPDQAEFQAAVVNDRKQLFDGRLSYQSHVSAPVDDAVIYRITLRALDDEASGWSETVEPALETRPFQVGGVQGASLASADRKVRGQLLADTRTRQLSPSPGTPPGGRGA
jgi:hypothetical protein